MFVSERIIKKHGMVYSELELERDDPMKIAEELAMPSPLRLIMAGPKSMTLFYRPLTSDSLILFPVVILYLSDSRKVFSYSSMFLKGKNKSKINRIYRLEKIPRKYRTYELMIKSGNPTRIDFALPNESFALMEDIETLIGEEFDLPEDL